MGEPIPGTSDPLLYAGDPGQARPVFPSSDNGGEKLHNQEAKGFSPTKLIVTESKTDNFIVFETLTKKINEKIDKNKIEWVFLPKEEKIIVPKPEVVVVKEKPIIM